MNKKVYETSLSFVDCKPAGDAKKLLKTNSNQSVPRGYKLIPSLGKKLAYFKHLEADWCCH